MIKKIIDKRNYIILLVILFLIIWILFFSKNKAYIESFNYEGEVITFSVYDKVNHKKLTADINNIYKEDVDFDDLKDIAKKMDTDYESIKVSYVIDMVLDYFKENGIKKYIINESGNIIAGKHYNNGKYKVSISNPNTDEVIGIAILENKAMATENDGLYDSVVVICNDNLMAKALANRLQSLDIDDGRVLAKKYECEVLWLDGEEIIKTASFDKYLKK